MMNIDVAVIISVYKNDTLYFLKQALNSLYDQSFKSFDIYLQCDGIIKKDVEIYLDQEQKNNRIKYIGKRKENKGLAASLNDLLREALKNNYKYIARMDSDDICNKVRFEKQYEFMESNPKIDVVGSSITEFYDDGAMKEVIYKTEHSRIFAEFAYKTALPHVSAFFRSSFFKKSGLYNENSNKNEDQWLWLKGFESGCKFASIPLPLVKVRLSDNLLKRRIDLKHNFDTYILRNKIVKRLKYPVYLYLFNLLVFFIKMLPPSFLRIIYKFK